MTIVNVLAHELQEARDTLRQVKNDIRWARAEMIRSGGVTRNGPLIHTRCLIVAYERLAEALTRIEGR